MMLAKLKFAMGLTSSLPPPPRQPATFYPPRPTTFLYFPHPPKPLQSTGTSDHTSGISYQELNKKLIEMDCTPLNSNELSKLIEALKKTISFAAKNEFTYQQIYKKRKNGELAVLTRLEDHIGFSFYTVDLEAPTSRSFLVRRAGKEEFKIILYGETPLHENVSQKRGSSKEIKLGLSFVCSLKKSHVIIQHIKKIVIANPALEETDRINKTTVLHKKIRADRYLLHDMRNSQDWRILRVPCSSLDDAGKGYCASRHIYTQDYLGKPINNDLLEKTISVNPQKTISAYIKMLQTPSTGNTLWDVKIPNIVYDPATEELHRVDTNSDVSSYISFVNLKLFLNMRSTNPSANIVSDFWERNAPALKVDCLFAATWTLFNLIFYPLHERYHDYFTWGTPDATTYGEQFKEVKKCIETLPQNQSVKRMAQALLADAANGRILGTTDLIARFEMLSSQF